MWIKSSSSTRPIELDTTSSKKFNYARRNIHEVVKTDEMGARTFFEYEENKILKSDWETYLEILYNTQRADEASDRIASGWDADKVCVAGQYKVDNGNLYKCLINNVNTPTTDTHYWKKTDIATELNNLLALINQA